MLTADFADMDVIFLDMQCSKTSVGSVGKLLKFIINKIHLRMKQSGSAAGAIQKSTHINIYSILSNRAF